MTYYYDLLDCPRYGYPYKYLIIYNEMKAIILPNGREILVMEAFRNGQCTQTFQNPENHSEMFEIINAGELEFQRMNVDKIITVRICTPVNRMSTIAPIEYKKYSLDNSI